LTPDVFEDYEVPNEKPPPDKKRKLPLTNSFGYVFTQKILYFKL